MGEGRRKIGGFTLIEIYTVMAIIAVLISISGLTTRTRNENLALSVQHEKLRSILIRAKSLAVNSAAISGTQICGYGVHIEPNEPSGRKIFVFADKGPCEGPGAAEKKFGPGDVQLSSSLDIFKEDSGIGFSCFYDYVSGFKTKDDGFINVACGKDIVFVPPDPKVYVNGSVPSVPVAVGVYSKRSPEKTKKIIINQAGLIDAIQK